MDEIRSLLAPLLEVLYAGRHLRLVARPDTVVLDRPDGSSSAGIAWDAEQHREVCAALSEPVRLSDGVAAAVISDVLVLMRPPDPLRRVEDLVQDGRVSSLAGRTLSAALATGRNLLVTGPWRAAIDLCAALVAEGSRPAVVGPVAQAAPPIWPVLADGDETAAYGADRIGVWSLPVGRLLPLMRQCSGCVAWLDAGRLDRALMRFEAGAELGVGRAASPLHVLAAVDIVVVMTSDGPRVCEVAEIGIVEDGYRPRLLFAIGLPPVPSALVPVGLPSFVDDLARAGQTVLADELRHAVGAQAPPEVPLARPGPPAPRPEPQVAVPTVERGGVPTPSPRMDPQLADAPPPGWELDQLGEEPAAADAGATASPEEAALAATFGLGPPPPPPGMAPMTPEAIGGGAESTFEDALARARERDEALRKEEGELTED